MKTTLFSIALLSTQLHALAGGPACVGFVAHEWGTFTSVQGADGIQLEWNPLVTTELPNFVYDLNRPAGPAPSPGEHRNQKFAETGIKSAFFALQRMETPVIYFYSELEQTVDVNVKFPQGLITEWYPQAQTGAVPSSGASVSGANRGKAARWEGVQVRPARANGALASLLPADPSGSHYYAARDAAADFLLVNAQGKGGPARPEYEKFLFYRGLGSFKAPLQFSLEGAGEDSVSLQNNGKDGLADLFILSVRAGQGTFTTLPRLGVGQTATVRINPGGKLRPLSSLAPDLSRQIEEALVRQGLYPAEAAAMVKTWRDSWFAEQGLRVLYILPRAWTDQVLPLEITPGPRELVRVMVGRAEMITPGMERALEKAASLYCEGSDADRAKAVQQVREIGLGRFSEPAVRLLAKRSPDSYFSRMSWELLEALRQSEASKPALAGK